jgi:hypothetical protein
MIKKNGLVQRETEHLIPGSNRLSEPQRFITAVYSRVAYSSACTVLTLTRRASEGSATAGPLAGASG